MMINVNRNKKIPFERWCPEEHSSATPGNSRSSLLSMMLDGIHFHTAANIRVQKVNNNNWQISCIFQNHTTRKQTFFPIDYFYARKSFHALRSLIVSAAFHTKYKILSVRQHKKNHSNCILGINIFVPFFFSFFLENNFSTG